MLKNKESFKLVISIILFILSFIFNDINLLLIIIAYLIISYELIINVGKNILKGDIFDEEFLMLIATIGAFIIGEYHEALAVMLFYQIGELLNDIATDKSKDNIVQLMNIKSDSATILKNNEETVVDPSLVKIDDVIIVKPGEKIPLDGTVIEGSSMLDTSSLTGESVPITVGINDNVCSGTINLNGVLSLRVTKTFKNSTVNKILELMEKSDNKKSETEKFITKFSKIYTPIVVCLAIIIFLVPGFITNDFATWGYRSLVFLVTSCPCALVISIPLSYFSAIGACSKKGILVKNSEALDKILEINEIIFDKTGTITEGVFEVVKVKSEKIISPKELLKIAATCEAHSSHPIAISIKERYGKKIDSKNLKNYKIVDGGITVNIDKDKYILGNSTLLDKHKIKYTKTNDVGTVVYIAKNKEYLGYILISDMIKKTSKRTISELKKRDLDDLVMLSGDNEEVVKDVCHKVGIKRYSAELLPQDKVTYLKVAKKEGIKTMFVGDGINDAPALMNSSLAVSMGKLGTDAAIEVSDIVIMNDDLSKINTVIDIAKFTKKIIYQNIIFVLIIKLLVLITASLGFSNMIMAVFADVGVTLITIINTFRIFKRK